MVLTETSMYLVLSHYPHENPLVKSVTKLWFLRYPYLVTYLQIPLWPHRKGECESKMWQEQNGWKDGATLEETAPIDLHTLRDPITPSLGRWGLDNGNFPVRLAAPHDYSVQSLRLLLVPTILSWGMVLTVLWHHSTRESDLCLILHVVA